MRALFGILCLLVALAIVASVARKQLQAADAGIATSRAAATAGASAGSDTVSQHSRAIQQQVRDDITRSLQQAAERNESADR